MRVGIIGTGLIGASIGLACKTRGDAVLGADRDGDALRRAIAMGAIDERAASNEIYSHCDTIVIALPLDATIDEVGSLANRTMRPEQLVIDVASVKAPVEEAGRANGAFVPTHPLAGGESSGPDAARAELLMKRRWCYVPTADDRRTRAAKAFIERTGAEAFAVDAREHDRIVAATSHMPQAVAFAFKRVLDAIEPTVAPGVVDALCGPVAKELLRIARSSPQMWDPIFAANAPAIDDAVTRLQDELHARRLSR